MTAALLIVPDKLDQALAQYDTEPDRLSLNNSAEYRGVDPNNKTASIRRTTKRLTAVHLDDMFVPPPPVPPGSEPSPTTSSVRPKYITQVDLNDKKENGRNFHEERIYAEPYKGHPNGGSSIPPPPSEPAPPPPPEENSGGHVVAISTKAHQYANVSGDIAVQKSNGCSSIESSFRPGVGARMTKEPHPAPPQHSRNSSLSSTVSSLSEHSEKPQPLSQKAEASVVVAADVHKPYFEPAPDYEDNDHVDLNAQVPPPSRPTRQAPPPPPPAQYTETTSTSSSQFSDAIKQAAKDRYDTEDFNNTVIYPNPAISAPPVISSVLVQNADVTVGLGFFLNIYVICLSTVWA